MKWLWIFLLTVSAYAQVPADCLHMWNPHAACSLYSYITPDAVSGANKLYLDIFNASGSGKMIRIISIYPIIKTDVAVTGLVGLRWDVFRTVSVGTGGTEAVYESPTRDVAGGNIAPYSSAYSWLPGGITARHLPTGGATIASWLLRGACMVEETNAATYICSGQTDFIPGVNMAAPQYFTLQEGQGLLIKQGPVASVNSVAFRVVFSVE